MIHRHRWILRGIQHVRDVSFGPPGLPRTDVLRRCTVCSKVKRDSIRGFWSEDEVAGD